MIGFLRIIGVVNASVWFGASVFFTLAVAPAFFSPEMLKILPLSHSGAVAQIMLSRYFTLHQVCGFIALVHLMVEWLYTGRAMEKPLLYLLIAVFALSLFGGYGLQPKMQELHLLQHAVNVSIEERAAASNKFGFLNILLQTVNAVVLLVLLYLLWRVTSPKAGPRFVSSAKFRS